MLRYATAPAIRAWQLILALVSLALWLIPRRGRPMRLKPRHEMHPMAYLDGLRGCCSIIIMTAHTMDRGWKWIPDSVLAVPWLQFPFRGGYASLSIFFWISGYTTTYKLCGLMQMRSNDQFHDSLASGIFRRYFRLFLPILPITLLSAILVKTGIANAPKERAERLAGNLLWWWIKDSAHVFNPYIEALGHYNSGTGSKLLEHTWSLGTEFRSSMIMYVFCAGTCKLSTKNRKILIWLAIPAIIAWQQHWSAMAFLGMWFSECRQERRLASDSKEGRSSLPIKAAEQSYQPNEPVKLHDEKSGKLRSSIRKLNPFDAQADAEKYQRLKTIGLVVLFLYSFIVMKDPYDTDKMTLFPHNYLNMMVPDWWHGQSRMHMHLAIGTFMMLLPLDLLPALQRPLLTPFVQYVGELSFGYYVVHITVKWVVLDGRYLKYVEDHYPHAKDRFLVMFPGWLMMVIVNLWAAELFRKIDMQSLSFCKWLEESTFEK